MTQKDPVSGIAIIVGTLMAILTMALHPVGGSLRDDIDYLTRIAPIAFWVHVLAIAAIAVQAFGFLGFRRTLGEGAAARAGLVAYAMAWIAVGGAALASGILSADMIRVYPRLDPADQTGMHAVWLYNHMVNQALAKVWVVGTCLGTLLWSLVTWRFGSAWKIASVIGFVVSGAGLLLIATGHLHLNVAGTTLFVVGVAAWSVAVGLLLLRPAVSRAP